MAEFAGTLLCAKTPHNTLAYTNRIYLHATDFAAYKGAAPPQGCPDGEVLLALTGDSGKELVYAAQANPPGTEIKAGTVGLSGTATHRSRFGTERADARHTIQTDHRPAAQYNYD